MRLEANQLMGNKLQNYTNNNIIINDFIRIELCARTARSLPLILYSYRRIYIYIYCAYLGAAAAAAFP